MWSEVDGAPEADLRIEGIRLGESHTGLRAVWGRLNRSDCLLLIEGLWFQVVVSLAGGWLGLGCNAVKLEDSLSRLWNCP